jgi:cytochrome c oxidase subunit 2
MPIQSALHPAGIEAARIAHLWWVTLSICAGVWVLVAAATLVAMRRGARSGAADVSDRTAGRSVTVAAVLTILTLVSLIFANVLTGRALEDVRTPDALRVQVTGNQWWWDVQYENPVPSLRVTTANELHIPVGRPVGVHLLSNDVIHSVWIPNLQGKIDLVPGRLNELWLRADRPGVYRGQCAEYCGTQHAKMALVVVAEPSDDFEHWLAANRAPAQAPITPAQQRGKDVFERGPCAMCHAIAGTLAGARSAPDLTHIASRSTLGAGTLPNTPGYLAGWITDPQHVKPGSHMPAPGLSGADLQDMLAYLETLK